MDQTERAEADHHVHFDVSCLKEETDAEDKSVTYQRIDDTVAINLGFLQLNHRYLIDLKLPATILANSPPDNNHFKPIVNTVPSLNCIIREFSGVKHNEHNIYEMKIEFHAYKEKSMSETLNIANANNPDEVFKLNLEAKVLGKDKGTPMLRNGIHCIGWEPEEEPEKDRVTALECCKTDSKDN